MLLRIGYGVACAALLLGNVADAVAGAQVRMAGQASTTYSLVEGDAARYEEDRQIRHGFSGGLDWLNLDAEDSEWRYSSEIRARNEMDLELNNRAERKGWGYVDQKASVYPHYYDSSNRFYDSPPRYYELDTTLRALRGDLSLEVGSDVEDWPHMFVGYRHQARDGETNSYWGSWLRDSTSNDDFITFVQPIERVRDERTNTLYVGATHEWAGWSLGARQDIMHFDGVDTYKELGYYDNGAFQFTRHYRNEPSYTMWTTTLNGARDLVEDRLRLTLDWRYAATHTDSTTDVDSFDAAGTARHIGEHSLNYNVAEHAGRSHSQASSARVDYTPLDWLRLWAGGTLLTGKAVGTSLRGEEGSEATASTVDNNPATVEEWWAAKTINREIGFTEELGTELNVLPKSRVAFDMVLDQNRAKYDWLADVTDNVGRNSGNDGDWNWLSTWWENRNRYTASFRTWAIPHVNLLTRYRYRVDTVDVDDQVDTANTKTGDPEYTETNTARYYPGTIEDARRGTHEFLVAPTVKLGPRWTFTPRFEHRTSHYEVSGDPESEISSFRSNTVAVGLMAQPTDALTCQLDVSRQFALTWTRAKSFTNTLNRTTAGVASARWFGGLTPEFDASYTAVNSRIEYRFSNRLTLFSVGGITDANGDFDTTLAFGGVGFRGPIGRSEGATWETAYRYYDYHEDEQNGINDYTAHVIMFVVRMPFEFSSSASQ